MGFNVILLDLVDHIRQKNHKHGYEFLAWLNPMDFYTPNKSGSHSSSQQIYYPMFAKSRQMSWGMVYQVRNTLIQYHSGKLFVCKARGDSNCEHSQKAS